MPGWIIPTDLPDSRYPSCVMLTDPDNDVKRCGQPAEGGHTILDVAICNDCYDNIGGTQCPS